MRYLILIMILAGCQQEKVIIKEKTDREYQKTIEAKLKAYQLNEVILERKINKLEELNLKCLYRSVE